LPLPVNGRMSVRCSALTQWRGPRRALSGAHPGCTERRDVKRLNWLEPGSCEYDGRLSLAVLEAPPATQGGGGARGRASNNRSRLFLYTRANPSLYGSRFVQVSSSDDGSETWSPFELVNISGYDFFTGDIYFFAVMANPVHRGSLLAIFPLVHKLKGCLGLAASRDGVRWSRITPLRACPVHGERTVDHPVAGLVHRGDEVWLYIHERVPGISADRLSPWPLFKHLELAAQPARLVRYRMPVALLRRWTRQSLRDVRLV